MRENSIDRFIGKFCKIVVQEPGEDRVHIIYGEVTDIDHEAGFIIVESNEGTGIINLEVVDAIKPTKKKEWIL